MSPNPKPLVRKAPANATERILVLGGDIDGNLGDRAILQATCRELRAICPDAEIAVVSGQPERWASEPGLRVLPRGVRGLASLARAAAQSDLVLCGGGGIFQDDDSLVKVPYWACRVGLARLLCRRVLGYSLGVGPLRAPVSRFFARLAFGCMEEITVRDRGAQRLTESLTKRPAPIVPDPALLLAAAPPETARNWLAEQGVPLNGTPLIGFTSRRWAPPRSRLIPHKIRERLPAPPAPGPEASRLVVLLARVLDEITAKRGALVLFLPSYNVAHEGDDRVCSAVRDAMTQHPGPILRIDEPALYKGVAAQLDVLFAGRMHPTIFAASEGTPVVGLAYGPKFHGFFELLGRSDQVMDVESFVHETRVAELVAMIDRAFGERAGLTDRVQALRNDTRDFLRRVAEGPA